MYVCASFPLVLGYDMGFDCNIVLVPGHYLSFYLFVFTRPVLKTMPFSREIKYTPLTQGIFTVSFLH